MSGLPQLPGFCRFRSRFAANEKAPRCRRIELRSNPGSLNLCAQCDCVIPKHPPKSAGCNQSVSRPQIGQQAVGSYSDTYLIGKDFSRRNVTMGSPRENGFNREYCGLVGQEWQVIVTQGLCGQRQKSPRLIAWFDFQRHQVAIALAPRLVVNQHLLVAPVAGEYVRA